jgi:hypothetical protein
MAIYISWNIYSTIKKNESYVIRRKWMELEIINLCEIRQAQNASTACSHSFVGSRPKLMTMVIIMGHECIWGTIWGEERILRGEEDVSIVHTY